MYVRKQFGSNPSTIQIAPIHIIPIPVRLRSSRFRNHSSSPTATTPHTETSRHELLSNTMGHGDCNEKRMSPLSPPAMRVHQIQATYAPAMAKKGAIPRSPRRHGARVQTSGTAIRNGKSQMDSLEAIPKRNAR